MKQIQITLALLASLTLNGMVFAAGPADIHAQIINGEYQAAYIQAEKLETAEGYALAAQTLLSEIMLGQADKNKKQAKRARKLAEAGLELDPSHQNARLQYAIADGFVARETGDISAWMKKLPQKTQAIIQAYQADYPTDPRGDALLGAWHLAVVRKGGKGNAEKLFGANIAQGHALFQKAWTEQPGDIVVGVNYAFSLLALKEDDFPDTEEARQILMAVIAIEPLDHLNRVTQKYAREALRQIDNRDVVSDYACLFLDGEVPTFK